MKTSVGVGKYKTVIGDGWVEFHDLKAKGVFTEPPYEQSVFWLASIGYCIEDLAQDYQTIARLTSESWADLGIRSRLNTVSEYACMYGRHVDYNNFYATYLYSDYATSDHRIIKKVAGSITTLASESVDLPSGYWYWVRFEVVGTTLKSYRATDPTASEPATPQLTVTDTDIANGRWGVRHWGLGGRGLHGLFYFLKQPTSTPQKPKKYYIVNLSECGGGVFKPDLPSEVTYVSKVTIHDKVRHEKLKKALSSKLSDDEINALSEALGFISLGEYVDKLACTWSALIPTVKGKPVDSVTIVRIYDVKDSRVLDEINSKGGKKVDRDVAIKKAIRFDDKLHKADLESVDEKHADEYIKWRRDVFKVEMDKEFAKRYVKTDKGW